MGALHPFIKAPAPHYALGTWQTVGWCLSSVSPQGAHNLAEHDRERINKGTKRMSSLPLRSLVISFILRDIYCMGKLLPTNPA